MTDIECNVKTRFAPSPTGLVHVGNIRTALFNALYAKHRDGTFLLRIEDTDQERSREEYMHQLEQDMLWLNLDWQEGPNHDCGNGPYRQSNRQSIYDDYYTRLEQAGGAYPCFCTEEELKLMRKVQLASGRPPRYAGTCKNLSDDQIKEKCAAGIKPTLRFSVPENEVIEFNDMVRGEMKFESNDIGDFIIRRADGTSPFMFCSVIDDALMGVTHVLRGEDHITNTPRQLMIVAALGLEAATYGHISLITAHDGSPLSKRHGSKSIKELNEKGYLPLAINNYLARLGHHYSQEEVMTFDELAAHFKVESLSKSPAKFNDEQLLFWQKECVAKLDNVQLKIWLEAVLVDLVPSEQMDAFLEFVKANITFPEDAKHWAEVIFSDLPEIDSHSKKILSDAGSEYFQQAQQAYAKYGSDVKAITNHLKEALGVKGKALFMPLRVAITGQEHGPELAKLVAMMSEQKINSRLLAAQEI